MKTLRDFPYHSALVLGLAKSGEAAAQVLFDSKISFKINDLTPLDENPIAGKYKEMGVEVITGGHPLSALDQVDVIIKNPGIPYHIDLLQEANRRGIPIITEVELVHYLADGPLIAITGSNGKTTTTTLVYELLKAGGLDPLIAGNIGKVASQVAREQKINQPMVIELSSFQLKGLINLKPDVSVLLNISEAHLDYHKTMTDYVESKFKITNNQTSNDLFIFNHDDDIIKERVIHSRANRIPFSVQGLNKQGIYFEDGWLTYQSKRIIHRDDIALFGDHNLENVLASVLIALYYGVELNTIKQVLHTFTGVKHRLQFVKTVHGRDVYNNSKATNISATKKAIASFRKPMVLIAGGLDRGIEFDELIESFDGVKHCVAYGESAIKIKQAAKRHHYSDITIVENIEQATIKAFQVSEPGDVLLFSPACASWDQFKSFEERGDMFIELVHRL